MSALNIDRFVFEVPQRTQEEAERLARLVAERLRIAVPHVDELTNVDRMNITVRDAAGRDADSLAEEIAEAVAREIARLA